MIEFMKAPSLTIAQFALLKGFPVQQIIRPEPGVDGGGAGGWEDRGIVERVSGDGYSGGAYRFSTRGWALATALFGPTYIAAFRAAWPEGPDT